MTEPHPLEPEAAPGVASAEEGFVVLDGPDGVAVVMEPDPAEETGRRLIEAARRAKDAANGARDGSLPD